MPLISKQKEVQIHLSTMYDTLQTSVEKMKGELKTHRSMYEDACHMHIKSGFKLENLWLRADQNYQDKFREFETHCFLLEILTDYRDEEGNFIHLEEFFLTLRSLLQKFVEQEAYEICAIIKKWHDRIQQDHGRS
ncbi:hypothetical protein [Sphingobacterium lactis]|uniref:Uncharacterized protein n=1 Tax=Sphingobacterium lactis TaxID=797291 RepID=A0A1H6CGE1_9SPHI|nr:hypothetical protein [Sphingobacterium lactis]SEG72061.1 hypothetical protein SAMN05421877_11570 [Sphingobacterium lactis]